MGSTSSTARRWTACTTQGSWFDTTSRSRDRPGASSARLRVTAKVGQVRCPQCRRRVTMSASGARRWIGHRCTQYRCDGVFELATDHTQTYYGRIYRSRRLERIYSQEHTGLLSREDRRAGGGGIQGGHKAGGAEPVRVHADAGDGHRHRRPLGGDVVLGATDHARTTCSGSAEPGGRPATPSA